MYNRRSSNTNTNTNLNSNSNSNSNTAGIGIEYGMESSSMSSSNDNVVALSSTASTSTSTSLLENNNNKQQTQTQAQTQTKAQTQAQAQTQKMIYIHKTCHRRRCVLPIIAMFICIWGLVGTCIVIELHNNNSHNNHFYYNDRNHPLSSLFQFQSLSSDKIGGSIIHHHESSSQKKKKKQKQKQNGYSNEINQRKQQMQPQPQPPQQPPPQQQQQQQSKFQLLSKDAPKCHPLSSPNEISLTLVTQISHDRLWMMEHHCNRYPHRISVAVYTNNTYEEILQELTDMNCITATRTTASNNSNNQNNHEQAEQEDTENTEKGKHPFVDVAILDAQIHGSWNDYPVNALRNLALQKVQTTHILFVDVDFWPSEHLYETIMGTTTTATATATDTVSTSKARLALFNDPKQVLVIPAFQLWRQCKEWKDCRTANIKYMARTLNGLAEGIKEQRITRFDPANQGGHGSTDYRKWFHQSIDGSILPIPCLQSNRYEPYVIIRYCQEIFPPYQSEFAGYGKNKVTWMMQVIASGFIFSQVGGAYLLHYPHLDSSSRQHWNNGDKNNKLKGYKRGQVDTLYFAFKTWLKETIPVEQKRVSLCEDAQDDDSKLWIDPKLKKEKKEK